MSTDMLDLLALPDRARVELRPSPLTLALCQVQFGPGLSLEDARLIAPFQAAMAPLYPLSSIAPREVTVHVDQSGMQQQVASLQWLFRDADDTWHLTLASDSITLETRRYGTFGDFLERLIAALEAFASIHSASAIKRIGLRYINEIREISWPWSDVIGAELLGPLAQPALAPYIKQALQELRLSYPNGECISLRHGLLPAGTSVQPRPGQHVPQIPFYLLDLDAFREFSPDVREPFDARAIRNHLEVFHVSIYRMFRWAVSEAYIQALAVQ